MFEWGEVSSILEVFGMFDLVFLEVDFELGFGVFKFGYFGADSVSFFG